jgi:hypothetical protein
MLPRKVVEFWTDLRGPAHARRMRRHAAGLCTALACAVALGLTGCGSRREARWLELERATPSVLEPGTTLKVEGSGFAAGQRCEVRLQGTGYRPGLPPRAVQAAWPGRAVSASEVAVPLGVEALAQLGGNGTFEGELMLAFEVRAGEGYVTGALPLRLDVSLPLARGVAYEQRLRERARRLLDFAGVAAAEEESVQAGLVVQYAREHSAAARLGLRQGDVIARAGGVSVHALSDLAPPPGARSLALLVNRPGTREEQRVTLSLLGLHAPDLSAELGRLAALGAWVLCCVLLLWPRGAIVRRLARTLLRLRRAPPSVMGVWGGVAAPVRRGRRRQRALRALRAALLPAALSLAGVLLVWLEPVGFLAVRSISIYLGLCAISVTLTLMSDAGSPAERRRAAAGLCGRMAVMGVVIACACALSGTRAFDGMVVGQGAWPSRWAVFQQPALLCAFPLYVVFAGRLGAATLALEAHGRTAQLLVAERVLTNVVLCALGVAIFAGGWQSPEEIFIDGIDPRLIGALLYVLKTWAFAFLLSFARRIGLGDGLRRRGIAATCAATTALTGLWLWLPPSPAVELAIGRALCASAAVVLVAALVTARRSLVGVAAGTDRPAPAYR